MKSIEQWKPIVGYEGLYEVSSLGRIKSLNYHRAGKEKILKPEKERNGYLRVGLWKNGKQKMFYVHRLVGEAFIPNPEKLPEINHKNENKANNAVENIEWCDRRYNINFGTRTERTSKAIEASRFSDFRTIELRFASANEAGRNGYNQGGVAACCRECFNREGNNKYRNLFWRFASVCESTSVIMQRRQIEIFANVINNFKQNHLI